MRGTFQVLGDGLLEVMHTSKPIRKQRKRTLLESRKALKAASKATGIPFGKLLAMVKR